MARRSFSQILHGLTNVRAGRASYETIRKRILAGARIDGTHLCLLMSAMIIASVGLNVDSTEAVVGAMLICPLMGSVIACAYAIATADIKLLREVLIGFVAQIVICLVTSTMYFVLSPLSQETSELLTNSSPTIWDVLIALAGGFAGGIGVSRNQEPTTLLAGVAVATALMPPLCAAGCGIAMANIAHFARALYEFLLNAVFIAFAAEVVFVLLNVPLKRDLNEDGFVTPQEDVEAHELSHRLRRRLIIGTLIFVIPCAYMTAELVRTTMAENGGEVFVIQDSYEVELTTRELEAVCPGFVGYRVGTEDSYDTVHDALSQRTIATITTTTALDDSTKTKLEALVRVHVSQLDDIRFVVS